MADTTKKNVLSHLYGSMDTYKKVIMNSSVHPSIDQLCDYLNQPDTVEGRKLSLHLAQCAACRSKLHTLSMLSKHLPEMQSDAFDQAVTENPKLIEIFDSQTMEQWVDGELTDNDSTRAKSQVQKDPLALKAALHYASHRTAMEKDLHLKGQSKLNEPAAASSKRKTGVTGFLPPLKQWLGRRIPLWFTLPATTLATAAIIGVLTLVVQTPNENYTIASYQDHAIIEFQEKSQTPGIGFFNTAPKSQKRFDDVQVRLEDGNRLTLTWPTVDHAQNYTLRLMIYENGRKVILDEKVTTVPTAQFQGIEIKSDHRYEWHLTGHTTYARRFTAKGGFVVGRP